MAGYADQFLLLLAGAPRLIGLVALAPGFAGDSVPPLVRVVLAFGLALAMGALMACPDPAILKLSAGGYLLLLCSELALGAVVGFCLSCLLEAARFAGELVDLQIGFRAGELYDPLAGGNSSILGRVWYMAALLFFFQVDGHHWLIGGLARSYAVCPVGELVFQRQLGLLAGEMLLSSFALALKLAAPVVASLILADVTLGLVSRGMPQMNILLVGMPAKIIVGLVALAACSPAMSSGLSDLAAVFRQTMMRLLTYL
jgi:flagellar biosynthetic protein FliR